MYQTILVPLDGSALSERAVPVVAFLARGTGAQVVLVRAVHTPGVPAAVLSEAQIADMDEAELYLKRVAAPLVEQGITVEVGVPYATAEDGIIDEINLRDAELVVMTTHGRTGFGRWMYGSVAEAVLSRSPVPVLLVRASDQPVPAPFDHPTPTILVPLDGSSFAEEALPHAMALAQALDAEVALVHVYEPPVLTENDLYTKVDKVGPKLTQEHQAIEQYIANLTHHLTSLGLRVRPILKAGDVVQSILEEEWASHASLVVMATHGRTGIRRALFGSVAMDIVRAGDLPVLLVRPVDFMSQPLEEQMAVPAK